MGYRGLTCVGFPGAPPGGLMKDGFTVLRKVFDATECSLDLEIDFVISTTIVALPCIAIICCNFLLRLLQQET